MTVKQVLRYDLVLFAPLVQNITGTHHNVLRLLTGEVSRNYAII